jgi:hypothetical protein
MYFSNRGGGDNCDNYSPASLNFDIDNGGADNGRATLTYPPYPQFATCIAIAASRGSLKPPRASIRCSLASSG